MKKSRTVRSAAGVESPPPRRLPLVELLIDTEAELFELAVLSGLQVLDAMLEDDRTAICGPRYARTRPTVRRPGPGRWPVRSSSAGARWQSGVPGSARRCCAVRKLTRNVPYPQTR